MTQHTCPRCGGKGSYGGIPDFPGDDVATTHTICDCPAGQSLQRRLEAQAPPPPDDPVAQLKGEIRDELFLNGMEDHPNVNLALAHIDSMVEQAFREYHQQVMAAVDAVCDMSLTARQEGRITEAERNAVTDALAVLRTRLAALAPPTDTHDDPVARAKQAVARLESLLEYMHQATQGELPFGLHAVLIVLKAQQEAIERLWSAIAALAPPGGDTR